MELKYILFDMDGVLLDSKASIFDATRFTLAHYGRSLSREDEGRIIGPPLYKIYTEIFGFDPETAKEAISIYHKRYAEVSYLLAKAFDGVPEMLAELEAHGKKLMLATARTQHVAEFMLEKIGIRQYFCYVGALAAAVPGTSGPIPGKRDVIRQVLKENDIFDREYACMIGDREEDILGGKENGLFTIGSLYGFGSPEEVSGADHLVSAPAEISRYIIENFE